MRSEWTHSLNFVGQSLKGTNKHIHIGFAHMHINTGNISATQIHIQTEYPGTSLICFTDFT